MSRILPKRLQSIFLATAMALTAPMTFADEAQQAPANENNPAENTTILTGLGPIMPTASATTSTAAKNIHEMDLPALIEKYQGNHQKAWEMYEFYQKRTIHFTGTVNEASVNEAITKLNVLEELDPGKEITFVVDSLGGYVTDGMRLYNKMRTCKSPIHTIGNNGVASMGTIILLAGDTRSATPDCHILIHQIAGGNSGKTDDIEHDMAHTQSLQDDLYQIIVKNTGMSYDDVYRICLEDMYFTAQESMKLGLIDSIKKEKPGRNIAPGSRKVPAEFFPEERRRKYHRDQSQVPAPKP